MPTQRHTLILILPAALGAVLLQSCSLRLPGQVSAADEKPVRLRVAVVPAERRDLSRGAELAAEFRPYQEVDVHAKVAGYLKYITVDVGDRVAQGQLIGELEVPEYAEEMSQASALEKRSELDVLRARSEVDRAQSAYDIRKLSFERLDAASKARPKLIARQEIDNAAAQHREAEAQLATAKAALVSLEQQVRVNAASTARMKTMLGYLRVVAPFSGMVTRRYADTGAMIQAGTASQTQAMPVVRVAQVDRLRLVLLVPESLVSRILVGGSVEVRVDSLQRVFQGKIARFTGQLNSGTRTMDTEVDIRNSDGLLRPGMYGYASLVLDTRRDALTVPVQAIAHGARPTVMVVGKEGRLEERAIQVGIETPNSAEILSGLQENELVLIGNRSGLKPGVRVDTKVLRPLDLEGGE